MLSCLASVSNCRTPSCVFYFFLSCSSEQMVEDKRSCPGDLPMCKYKCRLQDLQKRLMFVGELHPEGDEADGTNKKYLYISPLFRRFSCCCWSNGKESCHAAVATCLERGCCSCYSTRHVVAVEPLVLPRGWLIFSYVGETHGD